MTSVVPRKKFQWLLLLLMAASNFYALNVCAQESNAISEPLVKEVFSSDSNRDPLASIQEVEVFEYPGDLEPQSDSGEDRLGWFSTTRVGYDGGFIIANAQQQDLNSRDLPFCLQINGWGQLRHTIEVLQDSGREDVNQFALKRGRLIFQGSAYTPDFFYYIQLDGRSSSGDDVRLLDFYPNK